MKRVLFLILIGLIIGTLSPEKVKAQDDPTKGPKYGQDSAQCVMEISLYREFYKQWKASGYKNEAVKDARTHWRWVFNNCPLGTENTYVDGTRIYNYLIKKEKNKENKEKLIDTLMMIYDQRIEYFPLHYRTKKPQAGDILGRKGVDLYQLRPDAIEDIYEVLNESVQLEGNESPSAVLVYYFRITTKMVDEGKLPKEVVVDTYDQLSDILDYNIKNNAKKKKDYENARGNIELTFEPYANCEDLIGIYTKKFNEQGDDPEVLSKITSMLDKKDCTEEPLYFDATVKLYDVQPNPRSAYLIGKMYIKKSDYTNAVQYLLEAIEMEDEEDRANCYLLLADSYRNLNDYPKARSYAYKAAELKPDDGNPFILIGDLYAASSDQCGSNDLENKAVYWAAVDKYYQAKSVDPSLEEIANSRISSYSKAFPSTETIFFHDYTEGDSFTVECWINETTKVRASN